MALSQDYIETLRRAYAAFSRGDFDDALTYAHPDIEYVPAYGAAPVRGLEPLRSWMEPDAFEWQVIEPLDFRLEGFGDRKEGRARKAAGLAE